MRPLQTLPLLALLAACGAPPPSVIKTTSTPKQPAWLTKVPGEAGAKYFSGFKSGAETLDEGKSTATDAARVEAAKFIGVDVSGEFKSVSATDAAGDSFSATDTVKSRTMALIKNADVVDVYWEKNSRIAGASTIDRWDVSVLIKLSLADLDAERKRQDEEAKALAGSMLSRFHEGKAAEAGGQPLAALQRFRDVVNQLKGASKTVPTGDGSLSTVGVLLQAAQDGASRVQGRARRAILVGPDLVAGPLTQGLSKKGFSASQKPGASPDQAIAAARSEGLPYVIVVKSSTTPGGQAFGQVAAQVALDVRVLDAQSGAVVTSVQKTGKEFGKQPDAAERAAAGSVGAAAGSEVGTALLARETPAP
jgi:hypothetical protein